MNLKDEKEVPMYTLYILTAKACASWYFYNEYKFLIGMLARV